MTNKNLIREQLSDRYYEWIRWKGTRHEKDNLRDMKILIEALEKRI